MRLIALRKYIVPAFALAALAACQPANTESTATRLESSREIPSHWITSDLGRFTISFPPSLKQKDVQGIDSAVLAFESDDVDIAIEEGMYLATYQQTRSNYESTKESIALNGERVELITADLNRPHFENWAVNADGSTKVGKVEKPFLVAAYFPDRNFSIGVYTRTRESQVAKTIISSIRFK